ncbi:hypothetical protein AWQ21_03735 [Picosynechococcus sp. PCC 7003]|uniref:type IV pilus biogenesis protein EbsA n=1 Tax=Picosynechococcus sp. PCC 7003 TaxID=374981 RepID=UPI000810A1E0|nr:type IV pilus biogenesis protein EbsA [Picosynechococcus sp. PCC 7003]ANV83568.1 hypothetical protein AWQ21_03735 [Picosynechococcus sp. PCC 7003]
MAVFDDIQAAGKGEVMVYAPYYPKNKQKTLPKALGLYQIGAVEGKRVIEKGENIPFVASWYVSKLPSEMTSCRLQFAAQAELSYSVTLPNHQFVDYLIDLLIGFSRDGAIDFPKDFYRELLGLKKE